MVNVPKWRATAGRSVPVRVYEVATGKDHSRFLFKAPLSASLSHSPEGRVRRPIKAGAIIARGPVPAIPVLYSFVT